MKKLLGIIGLLVLLKGVLFALAGCGVEAPPEPPATPESGVTIDGDARMGVVFGS